MEFSSTLCWKWLQILVGTFSNYFRYIMHFTAQLQIFVTCCPTLIFFNEN